MHSKILLIYCTYKKLLKIKRDDIITLFFSKFYITRLTINHFCGLVLFSKYTVLDKHYL